jgi:chromate transporter
MPWEILKTFAWLGLTAFGGPAAHLAIFQHLLVGEGKWVSKAHYLRVLAVVNLIPGLVRPPSNWCRVPSRASN